MPDPILTPFFFKTAQSVVGTRVSAMQSAPELHLWVKHLKPVWRKDFFAMKQALISCYQEASDLGVLQGSQTVGEMVRFLL